MAECSECSKETMSFTCHYCGKKFCSEHRLPENHDCDGLDSGKKEEYLGTDEVQSNKASKQNGEASQKQKWFDEKFEKNDVKKEVRRNKTKRRGLGTDIIDTFKNSYTLSIIAVTSMAFLLQYVAPTSLINSLVLSPELTNVFTRPWTLLSVMFLHGGLFHLMANMITFYFFGRLVENAVGSLKLLKFYIGAGITASIAYVVVSNIYMFLHGSVFSSGIATLTPAVGASGAVVAFVGAAAVMYPDAEVLLYFVFPMKIWTAVRAFGAMEVINVAFKLSGTTLPVIGGFASSAHLAGLLLGIYVGKKWKSNVRKTSRIDLFS